MEKETVLEVENLHKSYGCRTVIDGLGFSIGKGEIFGLLGPNGAGKTTTVECILGTRKPDSGAVRLFGKRTMPPERALFNRIGVQFQESHYPDRIRVDELCRMYSALYREPDDWRELAVSFGLGPLSRSSVSALSGGERQKLTLVLSLLNKPEIVFLDELTTGLDPSARRDVWRGLRERQRKGLSVLLTSHFMDEAARLCGRLMIICGGREVIQGSPGEIVAKSGKQDLEEAYLYYVGKEDITDEKDSCAVMD